MTVAELQRSMCKYYINAVFTIVKPYDFNGAKADQLEMDYDSNMIATNLFDRYLWLIVNDVVQSSRQFSGFGHTNTHFQEDLNWSLTYFEKNTDPSLYAHVYSNMLT